MKEKTKQILTSHLYVIILLIGIVITNINCKSSSLRQYQNNDLLNFAHSIERKAYETGKEIWFNPNIGDNGRSCESCHPNGKMTNAETYPRYKHILKTMATISMTHNFAVVNESKGKAWVLGSENANAIALFVKFFANGKKIKMGPPESYKKEWINYGKTIFTSTNLSENDKSCESCHSEDGKRNANNNTIKPINLKGIAATYPKYSNRYNRVITLEQQINNCIETYLNGTPLSLDDVKIVSLCCYLTLLSEGKKVAVAQFNK